MDKSSDGTFDESTRVKGLKVFQKIKELAEAHQVHKIAAVATLAFRKAHNAANFVAEIEKQTQIKVRIIPQRQEEEIAFFSALASDGFNAEDADRYVRSFGRRAYPLVKQKIKSHRQVVGNGRLFYNSIRPLAADKEGKITRKGLRAFIRASLDKTDQELNNPCADVDVSNCILTLAVMKTLHIQEIYPVETTSTKGIMIYPAYWESL